jgi:tetratricopeptide (TPR) repeat protein
LQARLALGDLRLSLGQYAQAGETLQALTQEEDLGAELAPLAWHGLGQALEGSKDYAKAAEAYAQAISLAGPNLGRLYKLDRARVLKAAGEDKAAAQIYRELLAPPAPPSVQERARAALAAMGLEAPPAQEG